MSYTALYRKYRPDTFEGIIGQEHIVKTLKNQMKGGRVSHAYLFCGTRGTGKTSTAKIFARAINCLNPTEEGEPCNSCELCREILAGRSMNVIEIDAASNNSVDNVREIREEVKYPPAQGHFKVYIIDEVHMLSNSAFNALLKTLEEPPAHVIFILATTDPQKVPATILSRCQRFDFRRITTADVSKTLLGYIKEEGEDITPEAVNYIARLGDGSMRDSLSILDQCLAFYSGEKVTLDMVLDIMGAVDDRVLFDITEALGKKDSSRVMELVEEMMLSGRDMKQFVEEYIAHLRNFLMAATIAKAESILEVSEEEMAGLKREQEFLSPPEAIYILEEFSSLQRNMKYGANDRVLLEVALLRLCAPWSETDVNTLAARLSGVERRLQKGIVQTVVKEKSAEKAEKPKPKKKPPALPEDKKKLKEEWKRICSEAEDSVLKARLKETEIGFMEDEAVYIVCSYGALKDMLQGKTETITEIIEKATGKAFEVKLTDKESYDRWHEETYGKEESAEDDGEFESLMSSYLPEADIQN